VLIGLGYEAVEGGARRVRLQLCGSQLPGRPSGVRRADDFYVDDNRLLRTQTTAMQGRVMRIASRRSDSDHRTLLPLRGGGRHAPPYFPSGGCIHGGRRHFDGGLEGTLKQFASAMFGGTSGALPAGLLPIRRTRGDYSIYWTGVGWSLAAQA